MKYLFAIALLFALSCKTRSYQSFDYNHSKTPWLHAFKDRVFFTALREAYKYDTTIFKGIDRHDAFNTYDGLSSEEIKKADELGKSLIIKMPLPSMCDECKDGDNYFMASSLHYYASNDLDVIAKRLYKLHKKRDRKWE